MPSTMDEMLKARLEIYDPELAQIRMVVFIGILSTFSHGWGMIFSAPIWALGGLLTDWAVARSAIVNVMMTPWAGLKVHARYPQGLP
ncbi:MAG: hypothetical protein JSU61_03700, partial [Fidelibacterota bacterium]